MRGVVGQADERDLVQRPVRLAVATAVEPIAAGSPPDDAGIGEVPQRAANDALERSRCGFAQRSPALYVVVEFGDFHAEVVVTTGEPAKCSSGGGRDGIGRGSWAGCCQ